MSAVEVSVEVEADGGCLAKLSSATWELNLRARAHEIAALGSIRDADWSSRSSIGVGSVAGARAFWSYADGDVTVVVGQDDETWDLALTMPVIVVDRLVELAASIE